MKTSPEFDRLPLRSHWKNLCYIIRHKWFVFIECCRFGIPWQGIVHDLSKLSPSEWNPYTRAFFYSPSPRDATGAYDPLKLEGDMDYAWLHHQHHNPHHWQWWILRGDSDGQKCLPMPERYIREMIADWQGAGRAQGKPDTVLWYNANANKMVLHPNTRMRIPQILMRNNDAERPVREPGPSISGAAEGV